MVPRNTAVRAAVKNGRTALYPLSGFSWTVDNTKAPIVSFFVGTHPKGGWVAARQFGAAKALQLTGFFAPRLLRSKKNTKFVFCRVNANPYPDCLPE